MADSYIKSHDADLLATFCAGFENVIGPSAGAASGESDGVAYPAKGDPSYYYACIRSKDKIDLVDKIEICDKDEAVSVVGIWQD